MSRLINRRKDEYGGDIDNRSRFVREIARRVRDVIGERVAVIAKLNMDGLAGSIWIDEALRTAQLLDADRTLDAIELTQASRRGSYPSILPVPTRTDSLLWPNLDRRGGKSDPVDRSVQLGGSASPAVGCAEAGPGR